MRERLAAWIESSPIQRFIITLIIVNAVALGIETSPSITTAYQQPLKLLETVIISVFTIEILIKLYCYRWRFFSDGWNIMDLAIVAISLVPSAGPFAILRSLRILRVLRLLSTVPRLRALTESLLSAIPSIGWITFMLALVFYIFGVLGTELFGERFPDWFGTLGASVYTLFQIMTLESWSMGIARPVMEAYPFAWAYFVPFILISAFTILNLFVGVIVNSMQALHWEEEESKREENAALAHAERAELLALVRDTARRVREIEQSSPRDPPKDPG